MYADLIVRENVIKDLLLAMLSRTETFARDRASFSFREICSWSATNPATPSNQIVELALSRSATVSSIHRVTR